MIKIQLIIVFLFVAISTVLSQNKKYQSWNNVNIAIPEGEILQQSDSNIIIASDKYRCEYEIINRQKIRESELAQQIIDEIIFSGVNPTDSKLEYYCQNGNNPFSGVTFRASYIDSNNKNSYIAICAVAMTNTSHYLRITMYADATQKLLADEILYSLSEETNSKNLNSHQKLMTELGDGTIIFKNIATGLSQYMSLYTEQQLSEEINKAYESYKLTFNMPAPASQVFSRALVNVNVSVDKDGVLSKKTNIGKCKLWAILLADTKDERIGKEDSIDIRNIGCELSAICRCIGIECIIKCITGEDTYHKINLVRAIENIKPSSNDIVFFYYNGHGFRWDDQKDYYPMMSLYDSKKTFSNQYVVAVTDVYNAIVAKGARLNLIFADCCNSKFGENAPLQQGNTLFSRVSNNVSISRMNDLFINSKGTLLAAAAQPGEYAYSFSDYGSAFTQAFIKKLRNELSSNNTSAEANWKNIIDGAIKEARDKTTKECQTTQHGIRYMNVSKKINQ